MKKLVLLILMSAGALLLPAQQDFRYDFEDIESIRAAFGKKPQSTANARDGIQGRFLPFLKLDSLIRGEQNKTVYTYDANGEVAEFIFYDWVANSATWVPVSKSVYDRTDSQDIRTISSWDASSLEWVPASKFESSSIDNADIETAYVWDINSETWFTDYRITVIRNAEGETIGRTRVDWQSGTDEWESGERYVIVGTPFEYETTYSVWDASIQDWQFDKKTEHSKNADGLVTEIINYIWVAGEWLFNPYEGRLTYLYDDRDNEIEKTIEVRDSFNTTWVGKMRTASTYSFRDDITSITFYTYDVPSGEWIFQRIDKTFTYTYYNLMPEGSEKEVVEARWMPGPNQPVNSQKTIYSYDVAGNTTDRIVFYWHQENSEWIPLIWRNYEYDLSVSSADLILPATINDYEMLFKTNKLVCWTTFIPSVTEWTMFQKIYYYFSELTTDTREAPAVESLKVFPNPVGDVLSLATAATHATSYSITDLSGRLLQHEKSWSGDGIDVSQLSAGTYVIKLTEGQKVITARFVKL